MYQALYRKYRPRDFFEVVSQDHITQTLSGEIKSGKTAHAYLFTGSRGTGKTTCARIFAQAVNCLAPVDGNPCHKCEICKEAENGTLPDITEIDAASNNGVGDVRELRDFAVYAPERCRYKIYIIDEVHMLTKDAFNALLKITEEPPPHVKFVLATTEIHKVLPTVISRCQRFDFRRVSVADIIKRLMFVAEAEQISLEPNAAALIAKTADGAMRDALSLLDTCLAFDSAVTEKTVSEACGISGRDSLFALIKAVADKNAGEAIRITGELYAASKDLSQLCNELVEQFRNIMLLKTLQNSEDNIVCLPEEIAVLREIAAKLPLENIVHKLETLQGTAQAMGRAASKRAEFEISLINICREPVQSGQSPELSEKIARLENRISELERGIPQNGRGVSSPAAREIRQAEPPPVMQTDPLNESESEAAPTEKLSEWTEILEKLAEVSPGVAGTLRGSQALISGNLVTVIYKNVFFGELLKKKENALNLAKAIFDVTGKRCRIRQKYEPENAPDPDSPVSKILETAKQNGVSTEII
ncbi:MAG: DNA polymerase III subunit gamma/tau [Ruminococcus sp.]|jgi:DNA polymerase-3 subunit gamma/tau|nr:DNA polymerase III subunit gamma/tau [Ruminococcus sp.]